MTPRSLALLGAPVETGTHQPGCLMGPDAFRTAGLAAELSALGHEVTDLGNVTLPELVARAHANPAVHHLAETIGWTQALKEAAIRASAQVDLPIFLGGDHSLSAGTVAGVTTHAATQGQRQFMLWLDAHPDMHNPQTTASGNLHGTPVAYLMGQPGFDEFPTMDHPIDASDICMLGLRSVDPAERSLIAQSGVLAHDMRAIDETGIKTPLMAFLDRVAAANGRLHVSFDVDFLDPAIACAVGTTVPGGATFREAHLVMELLCESGLVTSLDMVELNPFLDERGRTARLMVDLCASLMGRTILDTPTRSY